MGSWNRRTSKLKRPSEECQGHEEWAALFRATNLNSLPRQLIISLRARAARSPILRALSCRQGAETLSLAKRTKYKKSSVTFYYLCVCVITIFCLLPEHRGGGGVSTVAATEILRRSDIISIRGSMLLYHIAATLSRHLTQWLGYIECLFLLENVL